MEYFAFFEFANASAMSFLRLGSATLHVAGDGISGRWR